MNVIFYHKVILVLGVISLMPLVLATSLEDPTRPNNHSAFAITPVPGAKKDDWKLHSTLIAPDRRIAVINGEQVSEGGSVNGAKVLQIRHSSVLIQTRDRDFTLHLFPDIVNTPSGATDRPL